MSPSVHTPDAARVVRSQPRAALRWLLLAGPAYTALLVVAAAAFPAPPGGDVAAAMDPGWLRHHAGTAIAQSYVRVLAALGFLLVSVAVGRVCRAVLASGTVAVASVAGGAACGTLMVAAQAVALASGQMAQHLTSNGALRTLGYLQGGLLDMASVPAAALFACLGVAGLKRSTVPRWLGWFSLVGAPLALLDAGSYDGGPLEAVGPVGLAYFLLWALLAGVVLARRIDDAP